MPIGSFLCSQDYGLFSLGSVGVPAKSYSRDVAITTDRVTVLVSPARIVEFAREKRPRLIEMIVGSPQDDWAALDHDPKDGALWVVSDSSLALLRIGPEGRRESIRIPRVEGSGGFRDVVVTNEALFLQPTEGTHGVIWRVDRNGTLLGRDFQPPPKGPDDLEVPKAGGGLVGANEKQEVHFLSWETGELLRANSDGTWTPTGVRFLPRDLNPRSRGMSGSGVGSPEKVRYFTDEASSLFFLQGDPVLLGGPAHGGNRSGSLLRRISTDGREAYGVETCAGEGFVSIASDATGFAAVTIGGSTKQYGDGPAQAVPALLMLGRWKGQP